MLESRLAATQSSSVYTKPTSHFASGRPQASEGGSVTLKTGWEVRRRHSVRGHFVSGTIPGFPLLLPYLLS